MDDQEAAQAAEAWLADPVPQPLAPGAQAQVNLNAAKASGQTPDFAAESRRLAAEIGVPEYTAQQAPDAVRQRSFEMGLTGLTIAAPKTTRFLGDPGKAAIVADSIDNLVAVEHAAGAPILYFETDKGRAEARVTPDGKTYFDGQDFTGAASSFKFVRPVYGSFGAQQTGTPGAAIDGLPERAPTIGSYAKGLAVQFEAGITRSTTGAKLQIADALNLDDAYPGTNARLMRDYAGAQLLTDVYDPAFKSGTAKGIYSGLASLAQQVPALAFSALERNPAPLLASMGIGVQTDAYGKYRERGGTPGQALLGGGIEGVVEVLTEMLPMERMIGALGKPGKKALTEFLVGMALDVPGEQIATFLQDATDTAIANPDKTWAQFAAERPDAAYQTLIATVTQGGIMSALHLGARRLGEQPVAEETATRLETLDKLATASPLRERDPAAFEAFVAEVVADGVDSVYVDAKTFAQAAANATPEELAILEGMASMQGLVEAAETGQDLKIPVAEFAARLAGTSLAPVIIENSRRYPFELSRAQAKVAREVQGEELKAQAEKVLASAQADDAFKASAKVVEDSFVAQLATANRFSPDVNKAYAKAHAAFYVVQAARHNTTPEEMAQRYPLRITAEEAPGTQPLRQEDGVRGLPDDLLGEITSTMMNVNAADDGSVQIPMTAAEVAALRAAGLTVNDAGKLDARSALALMDERYSRNQNPQVLRQTEYQGKNDGQAFYQRAVAKGDGRRFRDFFAGVTSGASGRPDKANDQRLVDLSEVADFSAEYNKHLGNFDKHIEASIPTFREVQHAVGAALVKALPDGSSMLDIAGSEGALAKAISAVSKGGIETVVLDPNQSMRETFANTSQVPGATFVMDAFTDTAADEGQTLWTEPALKGDGEIEIKGYTPSKPFTVVHEAMGFQFIHNDREAQVSRVKELLEEGGLAVFEEKFVPGNGLSPEQWKANEAKKDDFKRQFFSEADIAAKAKTVLQGETTDEEKVVGMNDLMVAPGDFENTLRGHFAFVVQFWDSGNFKGYMASDSAEMLSSVLENLIPLDSEFSTVSTPREVGAPAEALFAQSGKNDGQAFYQQSKAIEKVKAFFGPENVKGILNKDGWAILAAANPPGETRTAEENAAANDRLRADLDALGVDYVDANGKYGSEEPSLVVVGISKAQAQELGEKYGQDSILTREGLVYGSANKEFGYGAVTPAQGVEVYSERPEDLYTDIPALGTLFSVDLAFGEEIAAPVDRISTRQPSTKRAQEDALAEVLDVGIEPMARNEKVLAHNADLISTYPGFSSTATTPLGVVKDFAAFVESNLLWLFDRVPVATRERARLWYDGGNKLANRWGERYGVPPRAVAAVIASLSPQKDWYQNVSLAERILDITTHAADYVFDEQMTATAERIFGKPQYADAVASLKGKSLSEITNPVERAMWVRIYDEAHNPRGFRVTTPEGEFVGEAKGNVAWGSNVEIAKALEVLRDPSRENISRQMGTKHKVRSFYNNIIAPNAGSDVTIDTHAVAAGLVRPLSGGSPEVYHNFGSSPEKAKQPAGWRAAKNAADFGIEGTYGIYADAYRSAAAARGVLPREMQSVTWEAVRGLFEAKAKRAKGAQSLTGKVDAAWRAHEEGKATLDGTRNEIESLAGGVQPPSWEGLGAGVSGEAQAASYEGELVGRGVPRRAAGGLGDGSGNPAGAADVGTFAQSNPIFYSALARAVEASPTKRAPAAQWKATLAKTPGVKREEIEWTGVEEWLDLQEGVVERDDLQTFLAENGVQLFQNGGDRGSFDPNTNTINLLRRADLTTFMHESAHFYLNVLADMASRPDAPAEVVADMETTLRWFGVPNLQTWLSMSLDEQRPHQEKWARGYEAFLFEGKAPNLGMRELFAKFSAWMKLVYKSLTELNVELDDEVRGVFNRLLATSEEIAAAEDARSFLPIFQSKPEGMTDDEWVDYQRLGQQATADAASELQTRSLRDMKWLSNAKSRALRELQKGALAKRKNVRDEVTAEVQAEPVYRALAYLKRGEIDGVATADARKLSIPALKAANAGVAPELQDWTALGYGKYGMLAEDGMTPDEAAELFGFDSGGQLIDALLNAEPISDKIKGLTDQRMLERYGDLTDPATLARAAEQAVHNEARIRFVAAELNALAKGLGKPSILNAAVKEYAAGIIARLPIKELRPHRYTAAGMRAGKAAEKALAKGNQVEALTEKRNQLINIQAARAAWDARAEVDKGMALFARIARAKDDNVARSRNMDLVNAARAIMAAYGLGRAKNDPLGYMQALKRYDVDLFNDIEPFVTSATANPKPVEQLTYEEFLGLRDTVNQLWTLARRSKVIEIDGKQVEIDTVTAELGQRLDVLGVPDRNLDRAPTDGERKLRQLSGLRAATRRVEHWAQLLGKPFTRYIWNPVSDAADAYRAEKAVYMAKFLDLLKPIAPTLKPVKIAATEIGYTFSGKSELLHAILHTGNLSNKTKLLVGRKWGSLTPDGALNSARWEAFVNRMYDEGVITKADMDFAQNVWNLLEETKPLAQRAHHTMYGRYFAEVTADEVVTPFGTYAGGYVPALTDAFLVQDAALRAEAEAVEGGDHSMFPSPTKGFTQGRVENYNRELALDLRLLPQHIDKVLKFSHLGPPVRDVLRLLKAKGFSTKLEKFDPVAQGELLLPWLNRAVRQTVSTPMKGEAGRMADAFFKELRKRTGLQIMFGNLVNAIQQFTGFSVSLVKVKPTHMRAALWQYMRQPTELANAIASVSPFMAERMASQTFEINQAIDDIVLDPSKLDKTRDFFNRHGYFLQHAFQNVVDVTTWQGAYDQAQAGGMSHTEAVREANAAVRQTQGAMNPEDLSRVEAGNAVFRLFTQFSTYFNNMANLLGTEFAGTIRDAGFKGTPRLVYVYFTVFAIPALLSDLLVRAMRGEGDDEDDGWMDEFLDWFFGAQFRTLTAMIPVAGPAVQATVNTFNKKPYDDRIANSPALAALESAARAPKSVYAAATGDGSTKRAVKDVLTAVGLATGLPVAVIGKPVGYAIDVAEGKTKPTGPVDAARGAVSGTGPHF